MSRDGSVWYYGYDGHGNTSLHKYLYTNANPVMNTDPTGYFSIMEFEAAQTIEKILQAAYPTCFYKVMMMLEVASTCYSTTRQSVTSLLEGEKLGDVIGQWLYGMLFGIFLEALMGVACNVPKALIIALSIGSSYLSIKQIIAYIKSGDYDLAIAEAINLACAVTAIFKKCFTGDTLVATEEGYRRIDEIEVGDYVWAEDPLTGERALKKVLKVYVNETDTIIHIGTSSGEDIETTHNHPFYVEGKGWTAAAYLEEGDVLRTSDGTLVTVTYNYKEKLAEPIKVYNLEVEDFHTYYVTDEEVLVHNDCDVDLLDELIASGVKFNLNDIVMIMKNSKGKLMWLENGNKKAGLQHILMRHADQFADKGIKDIPSLLKKVLSTNPINSGSNDKGLFSDYLYNGNKYRVAYGTNGYIVSFYPID